MGQLGSVSWLLRGADMRVCEERSCLPLSVARLHVLARGTEGFGNSEWNPPHGLTHAFSPIEEFKPWLGFRMV